MSHLKSCRRLLRQMIATTSWMMGLDARPKLYHPEVVNVGQYVKHLGYLQPADFKHVCPYLNLIGSAIMMRVVYGWVLKMFRGSPEP